MPNDNNNNKENKKNFYSRMTGVFVEKARPKRELLRRSEFSAGDANLRKIIEDYTLDTLWGPVISVEIIQEKNHNRFSKTTITRAIKELGFYKIPHAHYLILVAHANGLSYQEIADQVNRQFCNIWRVIHKYTKTSPNSKPKSSPKP